jgi:Holliday junction resolvase
VSRAERDKGSRGEREVAAIFRAAGFDCDRTPNSGGLRILGDLYGEMPYHVEVKRQEVARPWVWWEQARSEAPADALAIVAFRRARSPWLALTDLGNLAHLLRAR